MQAVLQAAYIRQLLGVPPACTSYPPPQQQAQQQQGSSKAGAAAADQPDVRSLVAQSGKKARSSLQPFISQASPGSSGA